MRVSINKLDKSCLSQIKEGMKLNLVEWPVPIFLALNLEFALEVHG